LFTMQRDASHIDLSAFELRHLRYFVAVAEELHFGRAARRLGIAQPPLSQQIRQLEQRLGVSLFIRTSRQVALTPAGEALLRGARRVLAEMGLAAAAARRAEAGETDALRVAYTDSAALSVLPSAIQRFRSAMPTVHLDLVVAAGLGISLVPSSVANLQRRGVVYRVIPDAPPLAEIAAVYRAENWSKPLEAMLDALREGRGR
jgi:DNA-binding transcriptional LysR family regulator